MKKKKKKQFIKGWKIKEKKGVNSMRLKKTTDSKQ